MNETLRKSGTLKHVAFILVQALLAIGALFFVFQDRQRRREVAQAVRHASVTWTVAGVLSYGLVETLGGLRWVLLLRVQGFRLSLRRATAIFLIGLFTMTFTPGLIGGDAARAYLVMQEAPERKVPALLAVAMDRLMGLLSVMLLAAVVVVCRYRWLSQTPATSGLEYITLLILAGAGGVLVLSWLMAHLPRLAILDQYPMLGGKLRDIQSTFRAYRRHWPQLIRALLNTVVAHMFYFFTFYCAARALGAFAGGNPLRSLWDMICIMPIVNTLTGLPISFAGIGIRESLFQVLLKDLCGVPGGVGAAIGSLGFAMRAVWGLPGGVLMLRYRKSGRRG